MARRNDHTRNELKEMAIKSAITLIEQEGIGAATARRIAQEIGYTVGTLYQIFHNLDDMLLHVNGKTLDDMYGFLLEYTAKKTSDENAVKALARGYIAFTQKHYNRWQTLFSYTSPTETVTPDWYQEKISALFSLVESALGNRENASHHARILWASIHGICQLNITGSLKRAKAGSVEGMTDQLVTAYLKGI